MVKLVL